MMASEGEVGFLVRCSEPVWSKVLKPVRKEMARRGSAERPGAVASWDLLKRGRCYRKRTSRVWIEEEGKV